MGYYAKIFQYFFKYVKKLSEMYFCPFKTVFEWKIDNVRGKGESFFNYMHFK